MAQKCWIKLSTCLSVSILNLKMKKICSRIKQKKNNNKILVLLQPIKRKLILSISSGKISIRISNLGWSKTITIKASLPSLPDGTQLTISPNFHLWTNILLEWNKVKRTFTSWVVRIDNHYNTLLWLKN